MVWVRCKYRNLIRNEQIFPRKVQKQEAVVESCRVSLQFDLYALIDCTLYVELIILETSFKIQSFLISEALGRRTFIHHSPTLVA